MIPKSKSISRSHLSLVIAAALYAGSSSMATADTAKLSVNIPEQGAGSALVELGAKAGVPIHVPHTIANHVKLRSIKGDYTLSEALDAMLVGTGLTYYFTKDDTVVIKEDDSKDAKDDDREVEEVVVTGTLLRNVHPTSPVVTVDRAEIDRLGLSTVDDIIRSLPQNFSRLNRASSSSGGEVPGDNTNYGNQLLGQTGADLRGLGLDSTLVLIDGRRATGSATFNGEMVNLSTIPAASVERVEVLLDGASALYGADAIGGVINIITRKDYNGATTSFRTEKSTNGGDKYSLSQHIGFGWDSGRASITMSADKSKNISSYKAGYTTSDLSDRGGTDWRSTNTGATQPGTISEVDNSGSTPRVGDLIGALPLGTVVNGKFDPALVTPENAYNASESALRSVDSASTNKTQSLQLNIKQDITQDIQLYSDILYSRSENFTARTPRVTVLVPSTNAFNPYDRDVFVQYLMDSEVAQGFPQLITDSNQKRLEMTFGVKAELPFSDWQLDAYIQKGKSKPNARQTEFETNSSGTFIDPAILTALASDDPNVALNFFGAGLSADDLGLLESEMQVTQPSRAENDMITYNAKAEGALFELPGGEMRMALGYERRIQEIGAQYTDIDFDYGSPERVVSALFTELSVPVIGEQHEISGIHSLMFTAGGRWEEYKTDPVPGVDGAPDFMGSEFTHFSPKVGMRWSLVDNFTLRVNWGESFRAPSYDEVSGLTGDDRYSFNWFEFDPYNPDGPAYVPVVTYFGGANPNLKPETSETLTAGFDWYSHKFEGLSVNATYSQTNFIDRIETLSWAFLYPAEIIMAIPEYAQRDSDGYLVSIDQIPINLSERRSRTIDLGVNYRFETSFGDFVASLNGTKTLDLEDVFAPGQEAIQLVGTQYGPDEWKGRGMLSWYQNSASLNVIVNYSSPYEYTYTATLGGSLYEPVTNVESHITVDLTGSYKLEESGLTFLFGARDLFHARKPFLDKRSTPWDNSRVDPRGRTVYLEVRKDFEI